MDGWMVKDEESAGWKDVQEDKRKSLVTKGEIYSYGRGNKTKVL